MNRVVVTGLGVVSPIGQTVGNYWAGLIAGHSGLAPPTFAPAVQVNTKLVGQVKDFDPAAHFDPQRVGLLDRVSQFAVVAARQALAQSGLSLRDGLAERTAAIIGTGSGGHTTVDDSFRRLYAEGATRLNPLTIPRAMMSAAASQVSLYCGTKGPAYAVASACASATHAIGQAFHLLRAGGATCAVCGGTEASITFGALKGWEAMRIMAPDACRPFSRDRKGMVIGEGAGMLVLETLEHARGRGAEILAEIVGFGMSADSKDLTAPDPSGMARAINAALADAALAPDMIDYVNAHGTGTVANDEAETAALHMSFGGHARRLTVSSTKSMVGHALGAAGALELVAVVMALCDGVIPPTINYLGPDPACDLDYVPNEARQLPVAAALSNSFAFGGLNAVIAARKFTC
ncbi:MAG: beta-ketoacyl-[acyl-carrier-protein] synthase family protein [Xanthobacteraceae bacterium]|nr:beta-ketoacyl-[acyl-carrier-protein] synthase family protein [Xanthobacteraceae bacterium]